jgi:transcriptional regulator with XRE-family HTH domain
MRNTKVGKILNKLMLEQNLRVSELARRIKLPQPTLQRIAAGTCENPHTSSLQPIADFFSISIDQLKGLEPIPKLDKVFKLPVISWTEATYWNKKFTTTTEEYVLADVPVSSVSFALKVFDSAMEPLFPRGTLLIADPDIFPKDRNYIIALSMGANIPIFRQLIINGPDQFLKPLSPDTEIYRMTRLQNADTILATIVQARCNFLE